MANASGIFRDSDMIMSQFGFSIPTPVDRFGSVFGFLADRTVNAGLIDATGAELHPAKVKGYIRKPVEFGVEGGVVFNKTDVHWCFSNDGPTVSHVRLSDSNGDLLQIKLAKNVSLAAGDTFALPVRSLTLGMN